MACIAANLFPTVFMETTTTTKEEQMDGKIGDLRQIKMMPAWYGRMAMLDSSAAAKSITLKEVEVSTKLKV